MGRLMAIDYGTKRVGLAVSDPLQIIATGLDNIPTAEIFSFLSQYCQQENVEAFIIGQPIQMNGEVSPSAQHVVGFSRKLKKLFPNIPQFEVDERFTSKMAEKAILESGLKKSDRRDKSRVDIIAATIILQYYMEMHR